MTDVEALKEMMKIRREYDDSESFHIIAERLLIQILRDNGFKKTADYYTKQEKYY